MSAASTAKAAPAAAAVSPPTRFHVVWIPHCNKSRIQTLGSHSTLALAKEFLTATTGEALVELASRDRDLKALDEDGALHIQPDTGNYWLFAVPSAEQLADIGVDHGPAPSCACLAAGGVGHDIWIMETDRTPGELARSLAEFVV